MREYDILKFLYDNRTGERIDLVPWFIDKMPSPTRHELVEVSQILINLVDKKNFINISHTLFRNLGGRQNFPHPNGAGSEYKNVLSFQDLADLRATGYISNEMEAIIKEDGIKEVENLQRQKQADDLSDSVKEVNDSIVLLNGKTITNYTTQRNLTYAIFFAAAVSAIAAVIPVCNSFTKKTNDTALQDTMKSVQKKVTHLEEMLLNQKETAPSPPAVAKPDSLATKKSPGKPAAH